LVPFAFATITSMHFVLYSWLYQTPIYIVMAVLISLGAMTVMLTAPDARRTAGPARVSLLTGGFMLVTAAVFLSIYIIIDSSVSVYISLAYPRQLILSR